MSASYNGIEAPIPRDQATDFPIQTFYASTESPELDQKQEDNVDLEKNESTDNVEVKVESIKDPGVELTPNEAFRWNVDGDQSPFPEVAACVPNTDDPSIPCNTVRAWILLTVFVVLFAGVNQFFGLRYVCLLREIPRPG